MDYRPRRLAGEAAMSTDQQAGVLEPAIDIRLMYDLLGVDTDESHFRLVEAAKRESQALPQLVLSVLRAGGAELGTGAHDELRRAEQRHMTYKAVADQVSQATAGRVVKGPSIAACYPQGIRRPVGDLDVIVAGESRLWEAVRIVKEFESRCTIGVSVIGGQPVHFVVWLSWPGVDPALDPPHLVEICTAAFCGDMGAVTVRADLPSGHVEADVLSLAEERFQRPFGVRDILDILVLSRATTLNVQQLADGATRFLLAPELLELLKLASAHVDIGRLGALNRILADAANTELSRRRAPANGSGTTPVHHGVLLQERAWDTRFVSSVTHRWDGGQMLRTPVGDYLLVTGEIVTVEKYEDAMRELGCLPLAAKIGGP